MTRIQTLELSIFLLLLHLGALVLLFRALGNVGDNDVKVPATLSLTIPGRPVPKKNNQIMVKGRNLILPSKAYKEYYDFCIGTKKKMGWLVQFGNMQFQGPVRVDAHYWLPDYRWWPDLAGLIQATGDILEAAGILVNDKQITSWGTSAILGLSETPRTEITISEMNVSWWKW